MGIRDWLRSGNQKPESSNEQRQGPKTTKELFDLSKDLAFGLPSILPTEQDWWWFVVEQYDRTLSYPKAASDALAKTFPIALFEVEYEDRRSETSYVGAPNPGVEYLEEIIGKLSKSLPAGIPHLMITHAFCLFCAEHKNQINRLRLKYAVHFHNNCVSSGSFGSADKWNEVIESLGGD